MLVSRLVFKTIFYHSDLDLAGIIPDPDLALNHLTTVFNSITDRLAPFKKLRIKNRSNPWFTNVISLELRERDKAWRVARGSKREADWQIFKKLRNKCSLLITKAKSNYYYSSLVQCKNNPAKFWKIVKSLNSGPTPALPQSLETEAGPITDKHLMCGSFNKHFITTGNLFEISAPVEGLSSLDSSIHTMGETTNPLERII